MIIAEIHQTVRVRCDGPDISFDERVVGGFHHVRHMEIAVPVAIVMLSYHDYVVEALRQDRRQHLGIHQLAALSSGDENAGDLQTGTHPVACFTRTEPPMTSNRRSVLVLVMLTSKSPG